MAIQRVDDKWEQGEYLNFRDEGKPNPKAKTRIYRVQSRYNGATLGNVRWFAMWRQYVFYPAPNTFFDQKCLTDVVEYCKIKTAEYKAAK